MDNLTQTDNQAQDSVSATEGLEAGGTLETTPTATTTDAGSVAASWKNNLSTDLKNSPFLKKFDDNPDGLNKAFESHGNLEKLLGHDKVPIPKDVNDVEGWNRFSKAMGIPDKAENYGLPDASLPESMKGMTIDKNKLTPAQAKGLWKVYNEINVQAYNSHMETLKKNLNETVNTLKGEWGDAYDTNVELGQTVINKFSDSQEMNDYLTSALSSDPRGVKFLAKIGEQFAENKVGEFQMKRFTLAPEQAKDEIQKITRDMNHAYNNPGATDREHQAAVDYVNSLYAVITRAKG
jgi:hypothetical protein